jgi:N-acetylglucosamine kinase-like BadF-type ATPase
VKIYVEKIEIAGFAPQVLSAAVERDRVAHAILINNAKEMADLVRHLVMKVMPKRKLPVSLMGGLLDDENPYSKLVKEKIAAALPQVVVLKPKFPASFGAAIIGLNAFR